MNLPQTLPLAISMFKLMGVLKRFLFPKWLGVVCNLYLLGMSIPGFSVHVRPCKGKLGSIERPG